MNRSGPPRHHVDLFSMWNRIDLLALTNDPFYADFDLLPIDAASLHIFAQRIGCLSDKNLERLGDIIIEYTDSEVYDWLPADEQQWVNEFALQVHEEWLSRDSADSPN